MFQQIIRAITEHRYFVLLLGCAVVVKLFFAAFAPFRTDMSSWIGWGNQLVEFGISNFYASTSWTDYTPGYFYVLWLITLGQKIILPSLGGGALDFYYKLPVIFADLVTAVLIYRVMLMARRRHDDGVKIPLIVSGLYLFNPVTTFNGALWGQADSVHVMLLLFGWYYIVREKLVWSFVFFVLACVIKPLSGLLAPVYIYLLLRQTPLVSLKLIGVSVVTFFAVTVPFWGMAAPAKLMDQLRSSYELYPYASLNTFNYWGTFGFWVKDFTIVVAGFPAPVVAYVLLGVWLVGMFYFFVLVAQRKSWQQSLPLLSLISALLVLGGVSFMLRIHERYLYPFFAFFVVFLGYVAISHKKAFAYHRIFIVGLVLYILQSLVHWANLYYVYVQYLFWKDGGPQVPAENWLYWDIADSTVWWSWAQVVLTVVILVYAGWGVRFFIMEELKIKSEK